MAVYWTIAILTVLINLYPVKERKDYSIRLIVSLLPLFLYGAFRVDYGLDYVGYEDFFVGVKIFGHEWNDRMEFGYYYLNKILPSFRSLLIVQTILLCVAYYCLFKWYIPAKWAWLGFLLLFLNGPLTVFFMLSGIRNGIAISILILSTKFIHKRKIIPFAILIFVAYWFHNSVVLYAPIVYFVANWKPITKRSIFIWLSVMVFFAIASSTIILDYVNVFVVNYFERYTTYLELAKEQEKGAGLLASVFSLVASLLLFLNVKDKRMTAKMNMIVKLTLLFFLSFLLGPLNLRMSQYFASFLIASSVIVVSRGSNKYLKYGYVIVIFAYLLYALKIWFENPYFSYDTYQSVLF